MHNDGFSLTAKHGHDAIRAIHQLNQEGLPISLQISFQAPHPPYAATQKDYEMYEVENMILPENLHDTMEHSRHKEMKDRADKHGLGNSTLLKRWMATYYGSVSVVDEWVGRILSTIKSLGIEKETIVVFASDHREMRGSHGMDGKKAGGPASHDKLAIESDF
jgi:choline-sulfatase